MRELRIMLGARADGYRFNVDADLAANSGKDGDAVLSPKASLAYSPVDQIESPPPRQALSDLNRCAYWFH